jgi:hypothetical protein
MIGRTRSSRCFAGRSPKGARCVAVVSDEDWVRPALRALSFLLPGKAKGFRVAALAEAKAWLAAESHRQSG